MKILFNNSLKIINKVSITSPRTTKMYIWIINIVFITSKLFAMRRPHTARFQSTVSRSERNYWVQKGKQYGANPPYDDMMILLNNKILFFSGIYKYNNPMKNTNLYHGTSCRFKIQFYTEHFFTLFLQVVATTIVISVSISLFSTFWLFGEHPIKSDCNIKPLRSIQEMRENDRICNCSAIQAYNDIMCIKAGWDMLIESSTLNFCVEIKKFSLFTKYSFTQCCVVIFKSTPHFEIFIFYVATCKLRFLPLSCTMELFLSVFDSIFNPESRNIENLFAR